MQVFIKSDNINQSVREVETRFRILYQTEILV